MSISLLWLCPYKNRKLVHRGRQTHSTMYESRDQGDTCRPRSSDDFQQTTTSKDRVPKYIFLHHPRRSWPYQNGDSRIPAPELIYKFLLPKASSCEDKATRCHQHKTVGWTSLMPLLRSKHDSGLLYWASDPLSVKWEIPLPVHLYKSSRAKHSAKLSCYKSCIAIPGL